jgi:hypothetical protein
MTLERGIRRCVRPDVSSETKLRCCFEGFAWLGRFPYFFCSSLLLLPHLPAEMIDFAWKYTTLALLANVCKFVCLNCHPHGKKNLFAY